MTRRTATFDYRANWPVSGFRQGDHRSSSVGDTGAFRGDRLLREAGDARRLSLRTSVRDPFSRWWVREYLHHATLTLWILADVSRSMRIGSNCQVLADLIRSAALSTHRIGDRFGVLGAAGAIDENLSLPASLNPAGATRIAERYEQLDQHHNAPDINSIQGMRAATRRMGTGKSLVLLASDFHAPTNHWDAVFRALREHTVVPVVIWSQQDLLADHHRGLVTMRDAETGANRIVWMRPGLRKLIRRRLDERQQELDALFSRHRLLPVELEDPFDAARLTERFHRVVIRRNKPLKVSA